MLKTNHNPCPTNTQCFVNDQQTLGQASYKRKRQRSLYIYFVYLWFIYIFFHVFIATFHTKIKYPGTLHEYIDFGKKTFKCWHCNVFFWLNKHLHIQLNLIQDSLFVVLVGKLSFRDQCQHLIFLMTCLTIYLVRNPKSLAQIFVPTTLCLLVYPWEQILIN